jgi:hypothetical protein
LNPVSGWNQITSVYLVANVTDDIDHIERAQAVNTKKWTPACTIGIHDLIFQAVLIFAIIAWLIHMGKRCTE